MQLIQNKALQQELETLRKKVILLEKKADALQKQNDNMQFLEPLLTLIPEHIYWKNKESVYLGCNDHFAQMFGFSSRHQVIRKSEYELNNGANAASVIAHDQDVINNDKATFIEETAVNHKGEEKIFLSHKVPVHDKNGTLIGLMGVSFDITEHKKIEQENEQLRIEKAILEETEQLLLEKALLEEQESVMRLLASSMAHELRTPLSVIQIGAEGIESYFPPLLQSYQIAKEAGLDVPLIMSRQLEGLNKLTKNLQMETRAAFSIIDMLLINTNTLSIDANKFKECTIAACVEGAIARYPLQSDEVGKIHWQKSDFSFLGDELLMTHVLFNLLKNALYYLKAANKGEIHIWCEQNETQHLLHFKDTGLGMGADVLPHIFDRFYTRTHKGTGVGLAFCKLVMESFGGGITCQSIKDEFTDFTLSFPKCS